MIDRKPYRFLLQESSVESEILACWSCFVKRTRKEVKQTMIIARVESSAVSHEGLCRIG